MAHSYFYDTHKRIVCANANDENVGLVIQNFFPYLKALQVRKGSHNKLLSCMQMPDFTFECIF